MLKSMAVWDGYAGPISAYADVYHQLISENDYSTEAAGYLLGSLERYIQSYRLTTLAGHWKTVENLTAEYIARFELAPAESIKLNGLVGHHGIPRTFIFVYLHAKLLNELGQSSPWVQIQRMVADLELPNM
jgi:hypothetical protein